MARGRKPKPTGLKLLTGNPGKRPLNDAEPAPTLGLASPPKHLGKVARAKWAQLAADVAWLASVDGDAVALYCLAWEASVDALAKIAKTGGKVLTSDEGGLYQNPWVPIYNKAVEQLCKLGAVLGLNPSDRSRLKVEKSSGEDDALAEFMKAAR